LLLASDLPKGQERYNTGLANMKLNVHCSFA